VPTPPSQRRHLSGRRQRQTRTTLLFRMVAGTVLLLAPILAVSAMDPSRAAAVDPPTLTTDKPDYSPEETVHITGTGFLAGLSYDTPVIRPDGSIVTGDGTFTPGWDTVVADASGKFSYDYILDGIFGTYEVRVYLSPWNGDLSLQPVTSTTFDDGNVTFHGATGAPSSWTVSYTVYGGLNQTCSGTGTAGSKTISGTGTQTAGIGNGSLKLGTVTSADPSLVFSYWTKDSETGTVIADDACVAAPGGNVADLWAHFTTANQAPSVTAAPVSGTEGTAATETASFTDPNVGDVHTCIIDWGDGNTSAGSVSESSGSGTCGASHAYTDNGSFTVTVTVSDGSLSGSDTDTATVANVPPDVTLSGAASAFEGDTKTYTYTFTDPGADTWTHAVSCGGGTPSADSFSSATKSGSFNCTFPDNGTYLVSVTITDDDGGSDTDTISVAVANVPPDVTDADGLPNPSFVNFIVSALANFTDPGTADTHTCTINWGDLTSSVGTVSETNGSGTCSGTHTYGAAGTFTVTFTVTDKDGGSGSDSYVQTVQSGLSGLGSGTTITDSAFTIQDSLTELTEFEILKQAKDNTIIATNPGQFYMHGRVQNVRSNDVDIELTLDWYHNGTDGFITQGAVPVHCYIRPPSGGWSETPCTIGPIDNTTGQVTVTFYDVQPGWTVWVTVHLDYAPKGTKDPNLVPKSYTFTTTWKYDGVVVGSDSSTITGYPKKTTLVYGYVTDAAGSPIAGAQVTIYLTGGVTCTYTTGGDGFYVFYDGQSRSPDVGWSCSTTSGTVSLPNATYTLGIAVPAGYSTSSASCQTSGTAMVNVNTQGKAYRKDWKLYSTCP
jgi:hypothetical protein